MRSHWSSSLVKKPCTFYNELQGHFKLKHAFICHTIQLLPHLRRRCVTDPLGMEFNKNECNVSIMVKCLPFWDSTSILALSTSFTTEDLFDEDSSFCPSPFNHDALYSNWRFVHQITIILVCLSVNYEGSGFPCIQKEDKTRDDRLRGSEVLSHTSKLHNLP